MLLFTLVVIVLAVVVGVRKRKRGKRDRRDKERVNHATDQYYEFDDGAENGNSLQNEQTYQNKCNSEIAKHLLQISAHYEVSSAFINSVSADNSVGISMHDDCHSDVHHRAADSRGELEDTRRGREHYGEVMGSDWDRGGQYEELPSGGHYDVVPSEIKRAGHKDATSRNAQGQKVIDPEQMYAQPDKIKKNKASGREAEGKCEEKRPLPTHMYARPDMAKKKNRRQRKQEGEGGEKKLVPQVSLPYQWHKEYRSEGEEDGEAAPQLPPPYVPDEEQYYNTRSEARSLNQDKSYDYALVGQKL